MNPVQNAVTASRRTGGSRAESDGASSYDDPRVADALERYLEAIQAGRALDRTTFVSQYPEIAPALAECLEGLCFMHSAAPTVTRAPGKEPASEALAEKTPLGDYHILREVGRGGMGIVYEAQQLSLGRRVAVKVLPFAAALDAKQLQRFKNEALAAAHLQHPHIVPVYAVGCERGVHYYAMQFVDGQSLASLIRAMRPGTDNAEGSAQPKEPLTIEDGASNLAREGEAPAEPPTAFGSAGASPSQPRGISPEPAGVCPSSTTVALVTEHSRSRGRFFRHVAKLGKWAAEALEHAHQLGVIHRDVKPANLLLDGQGHLWITDFGLALVPNHVGVTMTGELVGTLRYMSPEQALAKHGLVDHRTDIYSLGVTLYELLTLQPAFPASDRQELLQSLAEDEPVPPRRLDPSIPRELQTVVLKSMAKTPADRYATAQELADDLQRFLDDQPIHARPPGLVAKTVKWGRRHRGLVASAIGMLLVAMVGLLVTTIVVAQAYESERQSAEEVRQQHARAEDNYLKARRAIDVYTRFSEELANDPALQGVRRRLLETALDYYQDFLEQHHNDPSIQSELAACQARVSRILTELCMLQGPTLLSILQDRKVEDDLQLDADQKQQVKELAATFSDEWLKGFWEFKKLNLEERRTKALESARATEKTLEDILTQEQMRRFKQIALQVQQHGRYGFSDPELLEALNLTNKQRDRIRKIQNESHLIVWDAAGPKGKKVPPKPTEVWAEAYEKILTVLTAQQRDQWGDMTGPPVKVQIHTAYLGEGLELRSPALAPPPPFQPPFRGGPPGGHGKKGRPGGPPKGW